MLQQCRSAVSELKTVLSVRFWFQVSDLQVLLGVLGWTLRTQRVRWLLPKLWVKLKIETIPYCCVNGSGMRPHGRGWDCVENQTNRKCHGGSWGLGNGWPCSGRMVGAAERQRFCSWLRGSGGWRGWWSSDSMTIVLCYFLSFLCYLLPLWSRPVGIHSIRR